MTAGLGDVFADTTFWVALVVKQDQYHVHAQQWSQRVSGRIVTTAAVILETANTLSRPAWRAHAVKLIDSLSRRADVEVRDLSTALWQRGWEHYRDRPDKAWSLTDCISFLVMEDVGLADALAADEHFRQAGFRPVLLDAP